MNTKNKKLSKDFLQGFVDGAYSDEELQALMTEFKEEEGRTGVQSPTVLLKIFEHLDRKFKEQAKAEFNK